MDKRNKSKLCVGDRIVFQSSGIWSGRGDEQSGEYL